MGLGLSFPHAVVLGDNFLYVARQNTCFSRLFFVLLTHYHKIVGGGLVERDSVRITPGFRKNSALISHS